MARTKALGGWLKQSKGKEKQRKVSASGKDREKLGVQLVAWRVRGCLWALTLLLAIVGNCTGKTFMFSDVWFCGPTIMVLQPHWVTLYLTSLHIPDLFSQ